MPAVARESIRKLAGLDFEILCLSHFMPMRKGAEGPIIGSKRVKIIGGVFVLTICGRRTSKLATNATNKTPAHWERHHARLR